MTEQHIIQPHVERDILARYMYAFTLLGLFAFARFGSPATPAGMLYNAPDGFGKILVYAAGVLAMLLGLDTFINDSLPPKFLLRWTSRYRHLLCVGGALIFLCAVYTTAVVPGPMLQTMVTVMLYAGWAVFGMGIAWRDVRRRPGHALQGS